MGEQGHRYADAAEEIEVEVRVDHAGGPVEGRSTLTVSPRLRSAALTAWRARHEIETTQLGDTVAAGYRLVLRAAGELLTTPAAASRSPAVRETMQQATSSPERAEHAQRRYYELAALAHAAANATDPSQRAALAATAVSLLGEHNRSADPELDHTVLTVAAELLGEPLRGRLVPSTTRRDLLLHPVRSLRRAIRRMRLRRWLRIHLPSARAAASRMLQDDDCLHVVRAFARAAFGRATFSSVAFTPSKGAESPLAVLLRPLVGGGFSPGDPNAQTPRTHDELLAWYWSRAKVLRTKTPVVRRLEAVVREVATLERITARETTTFGLPLPRGLRHREFRPDDDVGTLDCSIVLPTGELPLVGHALTFGVPSLVPTVSIPVHRVRTHVAAGVRKEQVLVQTATRKLSALSSELDDVQRVLFIRDSSGSMAGLVAGSSLDAVTVGIFSVLKTLAVTGAGQRMRFGLLDFSDRTEFSGWVAIDELRAVEQLALQPQDGGTTLDAKGLRDALAKQPRTLVLLMTDGALHIAGGSGTEVIALLSAQRTFVIAAAQAVSGFCEQAARAGIETLVLPSLAMIEDVFAGLLGTPE